MSDAKPYRLGLNQPAGSPTARAGATLGDVAPSSALPLLPFAFTESKAVFAALDGALGDRIRHELAANGLHAFRHCWQNGFHHLTTSVCPIRTADDLAGLKFRSPGGAIAADFFKSLGADAGMVPFSGMYEALKARQFDGQSDPLGVVLSLKLYEVQTYLSLTAHWWSGFTPLANATAWSALPRAVQEVIERNADTADTGSFRARLGDFYKGWRAKAGPEMWRLLESYAGEIRV